MIVLFSILHYPTITSSSLPNPILPCPKQSYPTDVLPVILPYTSLYYPFYPMAITFSYDYLNFKYNL